MHIPRLVCTPCAQEMVPANIGFRVEMLDSNDQPYVKVSSDTLVCLGCNITVQLMAQAPIAEHWEEKYASIDVGMKARYRR